MIVVVKLEALDAEDAEDADVADVADVADDADDADVAEDAEVADDAEDAEDAEDADVAEDADEAEVTEDAGELVDCEMGAVVCPVVVSVVVVGTDEELIVEVTLVDRVLVEAVLIDAALVKVLLVDEIPVKKLLVDSVLVVDALVKDVLVEGLFVELEIMVELLVDVERVAEVATVVVDVPLSVVEVLPWIGPKPELELVEELDVDAVVGVVQLDDCDVRNVLLVVEVEYPMGESEGVREEVADEELADTDDEVRVAETVGETVQSCHPDGTGTDVGLGPGTTNGGTVYTIVVVTVTSNSNLVGRAHDRVTQAVHSRSGTVVTVSVIVVVTVLGRISPTVYVTIRWGTRIVAGGAR
ncbi:hypothetical protein HRR85_001689 [Exophiala dermatitidis]|nr:hypothetical protein HRR85_001689 [Exophiala dermatitidis]